MSNIVKKESIKKNKKKVLVGMSGGVDSSVAAQLLVEQGYDVAGVFLHFWKDEGINASENRCCSLESLLDARKVAAKIGIPLYTFDFSKPFKKMGIEIGGTGPYYVASFDYEKNILYVVRTWNQEILYGDSLIAKNVNWLSEIEIKKE